jgi:hypothetical protein
LKINGYVEKIQRIAVAFPKWLVYKKSNGNAPPLIWRYEDDQHDRPRHNRSFQQPLPPFAGRDMLPVA